MDPLLEFSRLIVRSFQGTSWFCVSLDCSLTDFLMFVFSGHVLLNIPRVCWRLNAQQVIPLVRAPE